MGFWASLSHPAPPAPRDYLTVYSSFLVGTLGCSRYLLGSAHKDNLISLSLILWPPVSSSWVGWKFQEDVTCGGVSGRICLVPDPTGDRSMIFHNHLLFYSVLTPGFQVLKLFCNVNLLFTSLNLFLSLIRGKEVPDWSTCFQKPFIDTLLRGSVYISTQSLGGSRPLAPSQYRHHIQAFVIC